MSNLSLRKHIIGTNYSPRRITKFLLEFYVALGQRFRPHRSLITGKSLFSRENISCGMSREHCTLGRSLAQFVRKPGARGQRFASFVANDVSNESIENPTSKRRDVVVYNIGSVDHQANAVIATSDISLNDGINYIYNDGLPVKIRSGECKHSSVCKRLNICDCSRMSNVNA